MVLQRLLLIIALFFTVPAFAQDLGTVERKLEASRKQQLEQEAQAKTLKKELEDAKKNMIELAASIRKNETDIVTLEDRITALTGEQQQLTVRLEADYGSIGNLILALQRMRRTPPETLIIRPGAPLQTAQSAMLLQSMLPAISRRADALAADLQRLDTIRLTLESDRTAVLATRAALEQERAAMDKMLAAREKLYASAESSRAAAARDVERLAREAHNLRDLMQKLAEQEREKQRERERQEKSTPAGTGNRLASSLAETLPGLGKAQSPAAGTIKIAYGEKDEIGAQSEGITIESAANGLVVAPMGGIVRFAGPFKNYGNMVIVEHKKDYHSLIAGLHRLDVREGQGLNAGEPVGVLPASSSRGGKPTLYYELRQKGRPVDPATTFSGLRS